MDLWNIVLQFSTRFAIQTRAFTDWCIALWKRWSHHIVYSSMCRVYPVVHLRSFTPPKVDAGIHLSFAFQRRESRPVKPPAHCQLSSSSASGLKFHSEANFNRRLARLLGCLKQKLFMLWVVVLTARGGYDGHGQRLNSSPPFAVSVRKVGSSQN